MIAAARLYSMLVALLVVGSQVTVISPFTMSAVIGSLIVVVGLLLPIAFALASLGGEATKIERIALYLNKGYLFLVAAGSVGFAFKIEAEGWQYFLAYFIPAAFFGVAFVLNILALQRQVKLRGHSVAR